MHDSRTSPASANEQRLGEQHGEVSKRQLRHDELDRLTRLRAVDSLRQLLGDDDGEAIWGSACAAAGTAADQPLALDDLARVADELARQSGPIGLVGNSLSIRIRTYQMLAQTQRLDRYLA